MRYGGALAGFGPSGLWMPLAMPPAFVGQCAPRRSTWHLAQLALATIGAGDGGSLLMHVAALAGFTAVCFAIARRWLGRTA